MQSDLLNALATLPPPPFRMMHGVPQKIDHLVSGKAGLSGPEEYMRSGKGTASGVKASQSNVVMSGQVGRGEVGQGQSGGVKASQSNVVMSGQVVMG